MPGTRVRSPSTTAFEPVVCCRFPFLLVDRVVEIEAGKYAIGYKNVTINDEFFNGHFPGRPIMPGVLQVEAMAQLGGLVMLPEDGPAGTLPTLLCTVVPLFLLRLQLDPIVTLSTAGCCRHHISLWMTSFSPLVLCSECSCRRTF